MQQESLNEYIYSLRVTKNKHWKDIVDIINNEYNTNFTENALQKRLKRYKIKTNKQTTIYKTDNSFGVNVPANTTTYNDDGSITKEQIVDDDAGNLITKINKCGGNKNKILELLGYNSDNWILVMLKISNWEQHSKKNGTHNLHAIQYRVKPKNDIDISLEEKIDIANRVMTNKIIPLTKISFKKDNKNDKSFNKDKMMELTGIELHLGKLAYKEDTTQDYNYEIAKKRFEYIINEVIEYQKYQKCDTCFLCIGNDFFNYDTITGTTTKGTPQTNDLTYRRMFELGLKMYSDALQKLYYHFNNIEVRLQNGNHDKLTCFHLYLALKCGFKDIKKIHFSEDYKDVQAFVWGNNAIFYTHGNAKTKRLALSLPHEFSEIWGKTKNHELHIGHFHSENITQEENGIITRIVSSPTSIDDWHYENRFICAQQKYQVFVWDKNKGLEEIKHISFDE